MLRPRQPGATGGIGVWVGALVVAAFLQYGLTFARRYAAGRLSLHVQYDMRRDVFAALSRLDGAVVRRSGVSTRSSVTSTRPTTCRTQITARRGRQWIAHKRASFRPMARWVRARHAPPMLMPCPSSCPQT
jgi:hypothetical protein